MQGHISDFIQKDRASVGLLELSGFAAFSCAGERTAFIAEELRLEEILGDCAAVDRNKGLVFAAAGKVNGFCHDLFAGAGLSGDQDGKVAFGGFHPHLADPDDLDIISQHIFETALAEDIVLIALFVVIQFCLPVAAGDFLRPVGKLHLSCGPKQIM